MSQRLIGHWYSWPARGFVKKVPLLGAAAEPFLDHLAYSRPMLASPNVLVPEY